MPDMDGLGLDRELTARHPGLARRTVFVSGDALTSETQRFLSGAGTRSIGKAFSLRDLRQEVGDWDTSGGGRQR